METVLEALLLWSQGADVDYGAAAAAYMVWQRAGFVVVCYFFFFQAEDGIRDIGVTGVQTCALPISRPSPSTSTRPVSFWTTRATPRAPTGCARCRTAAPSGRCGCSGEARTRPRSTR